MMGPRQVAQGALFYAFSIEDHVPADHLLRRIDRFVDLSDIRRFLAPFYSATGRPSIDPELMIRMLIVGYCFGIRSERRARSAGPSSPTITAATATPVRPGRS
jgi:transposase